MAQLDINTIRDYLLKVGCKVEYPILVKAFKQYLYNADPNVQAEIRVRFKDYVNKLATVSLENNMKFINLRPEFRPKDKPEQQPTSAVGSKRSNNYAQETASAQRVHQPNLVQEKLLTPSPRTLVAGAGAGNNQYFFAPAPAHQQEPPPPVPQHHVRRNHDSHSNHVNQQIANQHQPPQIANNVLSAGKRQLQPLPTAQQYQQNQQYPAPKQPVPAQLKQYKQLPASPASPAAQATQDRTLPAPVPPPPVQRSHMSSAMANNGARHAQHDVQDGSMPPPPPPPPLATRRTNLLQRPETAFLTRSDSVTHNQTPPPRPPPRRRQSNASLFVATSTPLDQTQKPTLDKAKEIIDLAKKSNGRVKEHAQKLNLFTTPNDVNAIMPVKSSNNHLVAKENRLSRDSSYAGSLSSALHRSASHLTTRSRSSHREDESDSSSLQPIDPLRRKWSIEACQCNYDGLLALLREDSKLAHYRDIVNGYTALHWAAKFGNLDIIKLIAGTHGVSANIKSSAGYTPLHVAIRFNRNEAADLLLKSYKANPDIRDHSGKRPAQYCKNPSSSN